MWYERGGKLSEISKDERIKKEIRRLNGLFKGIEPKLKKTVQPLIDKAAFMCVTLDELQNHINKHGVTEEYKNGKEQFGVKKSSHVEVYNTMIKNYSSVMKQLTDLVPKEVVKKEEDDGFDEFVNNR